MTLDEALKDGFSPNNVSDDVKIGDCVEVRRVRFEHRIEVVTIQNNKDLKEIKRYGKSKR